MQQASNAESTVALVTKCCKPVSSFSVFYTWLSIPPNHILFTFFHSCEEFFMVSMELCSLSFQKDWLVLLFVCTFIIFCWEEVNTEGIIILKKFNYSLIIIIIRVFCPRADFSLQMQDQGGSFVQRQVFHCKLRNQGCSFTRDN